MKRAFFILVLFSIQHLLCQDEMVGKVTIINSFHYNFPRIDKANTRNRNKLNSIPHQIEFIQGAESKQIETDSTGIFKLKILNDSVFSILVNKGSKILNERFDYKTGIPDDTIKLNISDLKFVRYTDSILEPVFFSKYNMQQAYLDFKNEKPKILLPSVCFPNEDFNDKIRLLSEKYKFKIEYIQDPTLPQYRILYRYNQKTQLLLGITEKLF